MPRHNNSADEIQDESERLFLEQAKAYYRELRNVAENAPHGKIIPLADLCAFHKGRKLVQKSLEMIVQEQNDLLEKTKQGNVVAEEEAVKIERWQIVDPLSTLNFQQSEGATEFTTDGTTDLKQNNLYNCPFIDYGTYEIRGRKENSLSSFFENVA